MEGKDGIEIIRKYIQILAILVKEKALLRPKRNRSETVNVIFWTGFRSRF